MKTEYKIPERETETPFQFIAEDPLIACVGTNGGTYDYDIFRGFKQTVDLIIESSRKPGFIEDVMVYPMVFSARHAVELGLKLSIKELMGIYDLPLIDSRISIDMNGLNKELHQHDIESLTDYLEKLLAIDSRFSEYTEILRPLLSDYFFDKKGDMFRYAESIDGNPNLESEDITQVGLTHLYKRFLELYSYLDRLYNEAYYIRYEYSQGTYTSKFSREKLERLAKELPPISTWSDLSFDDVKENLKIKYSISGKELSKAIDCIKTKPHLSVLIENEIILTEIPIDELKSYAEYVNWFEEESKNDPDTISLSRINEDIIKDIQRREKARTEKTENISDDTLNKLQAFSIIGDEGLYSEQFEKTLSYVLESKYKRIYNLKRLCKADMFRCVLAGLKECGQTTYLSVLEKHARI